MSAYSDGKQVVGFDDYWKDTMDGVKELDDYTLDSGRQCIAIKDFEVNRDWGELKVFYDSDCVWTINKEDVSEVAYDRGVSLFDSIKPKRDKSQNFEPLFGNGYKVTYDGLEFVVDENIFSGSTTYGIFKFTYKNTGSVQQDLNLTGYMVRAYQDNVLLDGASFTFDDPVSEHINLFDIDDVQPGMEAPFYVAFEVIEETGEFNCVLDMGYITSDIIGEITDYR